MGAVLFLGAYSWRMCGRIVQATSPEEIAREFGADLSVALRESLSTPASGDTSLIRAGWYPRWNMAPLEPGTRDCSLYGGAW